MLHYRKNSKAIQKGKLIHFAPFDGIYIIFREFEDEKLLLILNKNEDKVTIDLERFNELQLRKNPVECHRSIKTVLEKNLTLEQKGAYLYSTKNR